MLKRIVGVDYDGGCVVGITVSGILEADKEELKTIHFAPIKHGHWVDDNDVFYPYSCHCSVCGCGALTKEETMYDYVKSEYCPKCGAKMDEVIE